MNFSLETIFSSKKLTIYYALWFFLEVIWITNIFFDDTHNHIVHFTKILNFGFHHSIYFSSKKLTLSLLLFCLTVHVLFQFFNRPKNVKTSHWIKFMKNLQRKYFFIPSIDFYQFFRPWSMKILANSESTTWSKFYMYT